MVHIDDIQLALRAWSNANNEQVVSVRCVDGTEERFYVASAEPIPEALPARIGDTLFNLRAALDYLVYDLHAIALGDGFTPSFARQTQFPIFTSEDGYRGRGSRMVGRLPERQRALIEGLQPYAQPAGDITDKQTRDNLGQLGVNDVLGHTQWFLGVLNALHIVDKHRRLHLLTSAVPFIPASSIPAEVRVEGTMSKVESGACIGKLLLADPDIPEVEVRFAHRFDVRVVVDDDAHDVVQVLMYLIDAVTAAIVRFKPYLTGTAA